jgi:hypothetical protein
MFGEKPEILVCPEDGCRRPGGYGALVDRSPGGINSGRDHQKRCLEVKALNIKLFAFFDRKFFLAQVIY